jgi:hypothetical protein
MWDIFPSDEAHEWERESRRAFKAKKTIHLGTFVLPKSPFPYFFTDRPLPTTFTQNSIASPEDFTVLDEETTVTVIIPSACIPISKPSRPRIWGGGSVSHSLPSQARRSDPHSVDATDRRGFHRRVYTDDSDIFLCALHSGYISWSLSAQARRNRLDLKVDIRIIRTTVDDSPRKSTPRDLPVTEEVIGRFLGGYGERYIGLKHDDDREDGELISDPESSEDEDDDGRSLMSCAWGSTHDGSGIEILGAEFITASVSTIILP